jgi:hypothetical protein
MQCAAGERRLRLFLIAASHVGPDRHPILVLGGFHFCDGIDQQLQIVDEIEPAAVEAADRHDKRILIGAYRKPCQYRGLVFFLGHHGLL